MDNDVKYMGDGVYVQPDGMGGIVLKANDHMDPTDTIYLEGPVLSSLINYLKTEKLI